MAVEGRAETSCPKAHGTSQRSLDQEGDCAEIGSISRRAQMPKFGRFDLAGRTRLANWGQRGVYIEILGTLAFIRRRRELNDFGRRLIEPTVDDSIWGRRLEST